MGFLAALLCNLEIGRQAVYPCMMGDGVLVMILSLLTLSYVVLDIHT